jgi:Nucleotidyltransferase domain
MALPGWPTDSGPATGRWANPEANVEQPEWLHEFVGRLSAVGGVIGIALGGSRARGRAKLDSDFDFGLFYEPERPLKVDSIRSISQEFDESGEPKAVTEIGQWGRWINGGAWMRVRGWKVDLLYRDLHLVRRIAAECRRGVFQTVYQAGHPNAFYSHILVAEVHYNQPLFDPRGSLAEIRGATTPYPAPLKSSIVAQFISEARFTRDIVETVAPRADSYYLSGCIFRCVSCLVQVLFAVNETYFTNEKGSLAVAASMERAPAQLESRVASLFSQAASTSAVELLAGLTSLVEDVAALAGRR